MVLDCCCRVLKCVLIVVNLFVTILGIALVVFGALAFKFVNEIEFSPSAISNSNNEDVYLSYGAIVVIAVGVLMSTIGVCGCCGAISESQCLLMTFAVIAFVCFVACVGGIVLMSQHKKAIVDQVKNRVNSMIIDGKNNLTEIFKCCLKNERNIYLNGTCEKSNYCDVVIGKRAENLTQFLIFILVATGIVLVLGFTSSVGLCCNIRKSGY